MIKKISDKLYQLFVTNTYAMAIQCDDGRYVTRYLPVTSLMIEEMLINKGSMGCYQQCYKSNMLRWICFDFDCPDKNNPDVAGLYESAVVPFTAILKKYHINYLTEFSGRRGIHVWIVFDSLIPKKEAYHILSALKQEFLSEMESDSVIHIDYFPATDSARGNVVGKQVKLPLSWHKSGGRSWLFEEYFVPIDKYEGTEFYKNQLEILEKYEFNKYEDVCRALEIENSDFLNRLKYKRYKVFGQIEITIADAISILSETKVYQFIFNRMSQGQAMRRDWTVLLGTFAYCDESGDFIRELFSLFPNYDLKKTTENVEKYRDKYYPATFEYLYHLYDIEMEEEIHPENTGFDFLLQRLGIESVAVEHGEKYIKKKKYLDMATAIRKEKKYLLQNDEVPNVNIWNSLCDLDGYNLERLYAMGTDVIESGCLDFEPDYRVYLRLENVDKLRVLVSLGAEDRALTTYIVLKLQDKIQCYWHSYSYNISLCSKEDIFYDWYSSWGEYVNRIKTFLEVPFMRQYHVFAMDLKGFYDHVDFLAVYQTLEDKLDVESKNMFRFLIQYNEQLMRRVNQDNRIGVPQGPAYARIIAEMYLDQILQKIYAEYNMEKIHIYRYVDDIVAFYQEKEDGEMLYKDMENTLLSYGLPINKEKSKIYGKISSLTHEERTTILRKDKFTYDLQENDYRGYLTEAERRRDIQNYLQKNEFDISNVGFVFGTRTYADAAISYFQKYAELIFESTIGRGNNFRKFYRYVFQNNTMFKTALEQELFERIPVNTINFSNLIHELYLLIQDKKIDMELFEQMQKNFLGTIVEKIESNEEKSIVQALLMITYKGEEWKNNY